jgi:hypothetical protein
MAASLQNVLEYDQLQIDVQLVPIGPLYHFSLKFPRATSDDDIVERTYAPPSRREMDEAIANVSRSGTGGVARAAPRESLDAVRELGTRLFTAVFGGSAGSRYLSALAEAETARRGLCVRLVLRDPELAATPWELLFDVFRDDFLALRSQLTLVRARPQTASLSTISGLTPPLRLLVLAPPEHLAPYCPELDAIVKLPPNTDLLDVEVHRGIAPGLLSEMIGSGKHHAVHLVGHGAQADQEPGSWRSGVTMWDGDGMPWELSTQAMVEQLGAARTVQLAILGGGQIDWLAGRIAEVVPSVIGVRGAISDRASFVFTSAIYQGILEGLPLVQAITRGRQAVDLEMPGSRQWVSFVAYVEGGSGVQLDIEAGETRSTATNASTTPFAIGTGSGSDEDDPDLRRLRLLLTIEQNNLATLEAQIGRYPSGEPGSLLEIAPPGLAETRQRVHDLRTEIEQKFGSM